MVSAGGEIGMDHVGDGDAVVQRVKAEGMGLLHDRVTGWVTQPEWLAWS